MKSEQNDRTYYVSIGILAQMVNYMKYVHLDIDRILCSQGLDPKILSSSDARIPYGKYIALETEAARVSGDPYFGLHMGESFEVGNWNILGYIMMNCRTIGEAFEKYARYSKINGNLMTWSVKMMQSNIVRHTLRAPAFVPQLSRHCFEAAIASSLQMARELSGIEVRLLEAGFAFPEPASRSEYDRFFQCPVLFDQKDYYMVMDLRIRDIPVKSPNAMLLENFENFAQEYLSKFENIGSTTSKVIKLILLHLDSQSLTVDKVAKELSVSTRTLQQHLKREGTEFSELLKQSRLKLSKKYLKEMYTVEQITYMLGFSDASVFRKSFRKWTGYSPKEYREMLTVR